MPRKATRTTILARTFRTSLSLASALTALAMTAPALAQSHPVTDIRPCMVAGAPPDSESIPFDPTVMSGRWDVNTPASPFGGVVSIQGGGTGVLIDSTHVLTAAHVIGSSGPTGMTVFVNSAGSKTLAITSQSVAVSSQFQGISGNDAGDIGIITLSQAVPASVLTYQLYTQPLSAGTTLVFVGYGATGSGATGYDEPYGSDTLKHVGQNNADMAAVADPSGGFDFAPLGPGSQTFLYDFDGPDTGTNIFGDPNDPKNQTLGNGRETTIGNGDSGGPAFVYDAATGRYLVAGINDFTFDLNSDTDHSHPNVGYFGSGGGGALVSAYTGFIASAAAPEPGPVTTVCLGAALLSLALWRARRRGVD